MTVWGGLHALAWFISGMHDILLLHLHWEFSLPPTVLFNRLDRLPTS